MRLKKLLPDVFTKQKWGRKKRLEFIDFHLFWEGEVTKSQVKNFFEASETTIQGDFKFYKEALGGRMFLDTEINRQRANEKFPPVLIDPDSDEYLYYLTQNANALDQVLNGRGSLRDSDVVYFPPLIQRQRQIDPGVLRMVIKSIREGLAIQVEYETPNAIKPGSIWIAPHALTHDGFRWACRCYRFDYERFGDVVLDRLLTVQDLRLHEKPSGDDDVEWNTEFPVSIGPNPGLEGHAQKHIVDQYGMVNGVATVNVRRAAIPYFLKRYQIEEKSQNKAPHQEPIIVLNRDEVTTAMPPHMRIPPRSE